MLFLRAKQTCEQSAIHTYANIGSSEPVNRVNVCKYNTNEKLNHTSYNSGEFSTCLTHTVAQVLKSFTIQGEKIPLSKSFTIQGEKIPLLKSFTIQGEIIPLVHLP